MRFDTNKAEIFGQTETKEKRRAKKSSINAGSIRLNQPRLVVPIQPLADPKIRAALSRAAGRHIKIIAKGITAKIDVEMIYNANNYFERSSSIELARNRFAGEGGVN